MTGLRGAGFIEFHMVSLVVVRLDQNPTLKLCQLLEKPISPPAASRVQSVDAYVGRKSR